MLFKFQNQFPDMVLINAMLINDFQISVENG